jgi:hypothetical protein
MPTEGGADMNKYRNTNRFLEDMYCAACVALLFGGYTLILLLTTTASETEWLHADSVLKIFPKAVTLWGIPILSLALFFFWKLQKPAQVQAISSPLKFAFSGAAIAIVVLLALRVMLGENLPAFIPPEESVKPGYLLGMSAGLGEELVMRLMLTPLIFIALRKWLGFYESVWTAIIFTALCFALWHEVGSIGEPFMLQYFATRFMVPGVIMGLATFCISPVFLVSLHCTSHIMIPLLFV